MFPRFSATPPGPALGMVGPVTVIDDLAVVDVVRNLDVVILDLDVDFAVDVVGFAVDVVYAVGWSVCWQFLPVYPLGHTHAKSFIRSRHVPP